MKKLLPVFVFTAFLFTNCSKSNADQTNAACDGLVTDTLGTNDNARIYMPNAFTPNADGLNDIIKPFTSNIASIVFTIYDENDNVVFTTNQIGQGWMTTAGINTSVKYHYRIQTITASNHKIGTCGDLYKVTCRPANAPAFYFEDQLTASGFTGPTSENLSLCP